MGNSSDANPVHLIVLKRIPFDRANDAPIAPPGDSRIWSALAGSFGTIYGSERTLLRIEWPSGEPLPDADFYRKALALNGLYDLQLIAALPRDSILIRGRGGLADPIATLLWEWCKANGFRPTAEFWSARLIELWSEKADTPFVEAIERVLLLGDRSGLYHPDIEEAQAFAKGSSPAWPLVLPEQRLPEQLSLEKLFAESLRSNEASFVRRHVTIREHRPRTPVAVTELKPAIDALLWSWNSVAGLNALGTHSGSPLHVIAGIPARSDQPDWARTIRRHCEKLASLYDRSIGTLELRASRTLVPTLELTSPLPLAHRALRPGGANKTSLYALGPWDGRNGLIERRIESFARVVTDFMEEAEIIEGSQDWITRLGAATRDLPGVLFQPEALKRLIEANLLRARAQRMAYFWGEDDLLQRIPPHGLPIQLVATRTTSGTLQIGIFEAPMDFLRPDIGSLEEDVHWHSPELKSPTYGYEKATLFPDRYLTKILGRDQSHFDWRRQLWVSAGGDRQRSAPFRNDLCSSLNGFRWTDGETMWAEASGSREGWTDVDPKYAGIACVDAALRALLCLGSPPRSGGIANVWITQPDKVNDSEEERMHLGAYMLATQGLLQAIQAFRFKVHHFNAFAPTFGTQRPEVRVYLRTRLDHLAPQVIPGFRMSGEVLYAVGPRPAFMDAGSLLLDHVKVMSNHLSKLVPTAQIELYDLIWDLMKKGVITSIRPIGEGGIAETAAEMALWGGMGAQIRPNLSTIELFSGAPGRLLLGVLPSEAKRFESLVKSELLTTIGTSGGEKVLGVPVDQLKDARRGMVQG